MRPHHIFLPVITSALLISCDPCKNLDCVSSDYDGQFRIVSAANGQSLVFGPNKIYDKNQIRFYSVNGADTTFYSFATIPYGTTGYDSSLVVQFFPKVDVAYLRLSNSDTDTLNISYSDRDTKCCGTITEITNFRFNNLLDLSGKGIQEIKK